MIVRPWTVLASEELLDCRILSVERTRCQSPVDESVHEFFRLRSVDWAMVVPITAAGEIVLVRQYRHGSGALSLEIPSGLVDPGETPIQAAARECLEETGYRADGLQPFCVLRPNPALFTNRLHAFVARGVRKVSEIAQTATEHTEVELVPGQQVGDFLRDGRIDHALDSAVLWRLVHEVL